LLGLKEHGILLASKDNSKLISRVMVCILQVGLPNYNIPYFSHLSANFVTYVKQTAIYIA
jgi:hypothetical protein